MNLSTYFILPLCKALHNGKTYIIREFAKNNFD